MNVTQELESLLKGANDVYVVRVSHSEAKKNSLELILAPCSTQIVSRNELSDYRILLTFQQSRYSDIAGMRLRLITSIRNLSASSYMSTSWHWKTRWVSASSKRSEVLQLFNRFVLCGRPDSPSSRSSSFLIGIYLFSLWSSLSSVRTPHSNFRLEHTSDIVLKAFVREGDSNVSYRYSSVRPFQLHSVPHWLSSMLIRLTDYNFKDV